MPIFARRTLQRLLDDAVQAGLASERASTLVATINEHSYAAIAAEWELVAIGTLSRLAKISYEPNLGGEARADLLLLDKEARFPRLLIEVASVSDRGLDADYPVHELFDAIASAARSEGVITNRLKLTVPTGLPPNGSRQPLPSRADIPTIVSRRIRPFLRKVRADADVRHGLEMEHGASHFQLLYDPEQAWTSITYANYAKPRDVRKNPLWNSLKTETQQLKRSNYDGVAGILLCDGGCQGFVDEKFTAQVCKELFRNYRSVSFVALLGIASRSEPKHRRLRAELRVYPNERARHTMPAGLDAYLSDAISALPHALATGGEAHANLRHTPGPLWGSVFSSWKGGRREFALSVRALQLVLGGKVDCQEILSDPKFSGPPAGIGTSNFLASMFEAGYSIAGSRIERLPDQDDDWIIFSFMNVQDPALVGLRLPPIKSPIRPRRRDS